MLDRLDGNLLQWLRGFYYVVKYESVVRAASHMGLEASAVSHQLRNLEKAFNTKFFVRKNKRLILTEAGALLYRKAMPLLQHAQTLVDEMGGDSGVLKGRVRISSTHAIAKHFLTATMLRFRKKHPHVVFEMKGGGFAFIVNAILTGEADFGIVSLGEFPDSVIVKPLFDSQLVVIGPKENIFGIPEKPTLRDLSTVPFISFPPFGTIDSFINPTMQQHGLHFNKRIIADTYGLLLHYAQCGLGITILDMFTIEDCMDNVSTYTLHDVLPPRRVVLIFHENAYMTAQSIEFQNYILRSPLPYGCSHFLK